MDIITGISDPIIRDFALSLAAEGKKPKTIKIYTSAASWLMEVQELEDWSTVKKSDVRRHVASILENRSHSYANNQYRALQQFFKFLESEDVRQRSALQTSAKEGASSTTKGHE